MKYIIIIILMLIFVFGGLYTSLSDQFFAKKHNCTAITRTFNDSIYICYGEQIGGGSNSNWRVVEK